MNLILLFKDDFIPGTNMVHLDGRRLEHIQNVHRAAIGDTLTVGIENGKVGTGTITKLSDKFLEMDIAEENEPPAPSHVNLILALPRPKVISRVILSASTLGIKKIWLVNAKRVEKSYWQSPRLSEENLNKQLVLGLEQSKDTIMPQIIKKPLFKPFVEDELPEIMKGTLPLVAHPATVDSSPERSGRQITLAIGPEGGFIPYEIEKLIEYGFTPFTIGERILRVETVIPYIIGKLS